MKDEGSFEFVEDVTSDLTFVARGGTPEAVFRGAAEALLAATVESSASVQDRVTRSVALADTGLDLLLARFLNELIFLRDAEGLLLRAGRLALARDDELRLDADLRGELFDPSRHRPASDVKAVTMHGLRFVRAGSGWEAQVTLDV
jgi:SHS2 domain-containing protein